MKKIDCDPHPGNFRIVKKLIFKFHIVILLGNVLVRRNKGLDEIILLDHGLYVELSNDLRLNYAQLWLALMKPDMNEVERISKRMGLLKYFQIFACILTSRPWRILESRKGIARTKIGDAEGVELGQNASAFIDEISIVLDSIPRQMLLILKTNDLLRAISLRLNTQNRLGSFTEMLRCCTKAVFAERITSTNSMLKRMYYRVLIMYLLIKIRLVEFYLFVSEVLGIENKLSL